MVPQLVRRAKLVEDPHNLVRMWNQIGGKAQSNQKIDRRPHHLTYIQQPTSQHVVDDPFRWIPLEWYGDDFRFVTRISQRIAQAFRMNLSATTNKWDLDGSN